MNNNPTPDPTHGLSVQQADALWDAVAIPGPQEPTFPVQHERVCRAVAGILDELAPAVPSVSAVGQTTRDRIAEALYERERPPRDPHWPKAFAADREVFEAMAAAVLAVLPPTADRAAVLREAATAIEAEQAREEATEWARFGELDHETEVGGGAVHAMAALLRRMAGEAQQQEAETGDDQGAALTDDYLKFLRGQGPEPDLSELPPARRESVAGQFEIVRALADRDPSLPPLDRDPVARRLGLLQADDEAQQQPDTETRTVTLADVYSRLADEAAEWTGVITEKELRRKARAAEQAAVFVVSGLRAADDKQDGAREVIHGCPPDGSGLTPCCGRTPVELPLGDRISSEAPITCRGAQ